MSDGQRRWSQHDLDELVRIYWTDIAPAMRRDDLDPDAEKPSFEWLAENGFRGLDYALREQHDLTLTDFFVDEVGVGERYHSDSYDWGIDDEAAVTALEEFVTSMQRRREDISETTATTKRSRLAKYARTFADLHDASDILDIARDESTKPEARRKVLSVFDVLNEELGSNDTKIRYHADVSEFYARLVNWGQVAFNPVEGIREEYGWSRDEPDNPALATADVRALYREASSTEERLLVVGLAGWGLRTSELARLHRSQINLDDADDPHIEFETRKNGPSTVAIIYGLDELADRIDELAVDEEWNGYLFPSTQSASGHISSETVRSRFARLCERTGVLVDGDNPQPKMGRRYWYDSYLSAVGNMIETLDEIAGDQGSDSASVIASNYLSEDRRRRERREFMRDRLRDAFSG